MIDYYLWLAVGATIAGIIGALLAPSRDLPPWAGFLLGLLLGVFGIAIVALIRPVKYRALNTTSFVPPGWYPDPHGPSQRWWTGAQWHEAVR